MRQQQDEPGRFSICSRQAAVVQFFSGICTINKFIPW
ncbi:PhoP/PhoQ regulator MgrB [Klebsiella pneumoniae]|nr:PhoP/PhoQ regulator MgrB [Klebsiella pneumoniae]